MSKVQWLGETVAECKANPSKRTDCKIFAQSIAVATGAWPLVPLTQFYVDKCMDYYCSTGTTPSSTGDLPAPPPVYEPYPWGVYDPGTVVLQGELNKKLKADGLCPLTPDGKVGAGTCGAAKKYGVPLPSCAGHAATTPAPCGVTPKTEPVPPPATMITPPKKDVPWVPILLVGGVAAAAVFFMVRGGGGSGLLAARANPDAWGREYLQVDNMDPPDAQGRHPRYKHLVMFEIEPHYGSYILTATGHKGDALISSEEAQQMFGKDYDDGFGYLTDEYLQILKKSPTDNPRAKKASKWKGFELDLDAKLPLGTVVMTPGVREKVTSGEAGVALMRHMSKDWGDVSQEDWEENLRALRDGDRVLSAYRTKAGKKFWIVTEADRSVTTLLLPEEY